MSETIRVLLADSHQLLHDGIQTSLAFAPDLVLVGEATTTEELWPLCRKHQPDVLLLATNLTDLPLIGVFTQVRQCCPETLIVALLSEPGEVSLQQLTENGAAGGILKSEPPETLITAVRTVAGGHPWFSPPLLKRMLAQEEPALTGEEINILRLMVAGETDRAIAKAADISQRTLRRRLKQICRKLCVSTRIEAAYLVGLRRLLEE